MTKKVEIETSGARIQAGTPSIDGVTIGPSTSGYPVEDMFSSIDALDGAKVEFLGRIPAEVSRQANEYLLLRVRKGRRTFRIILVAAEIMRPCPPGDEMWDLMEVFFTAEEIRARYKHKPLDLPRFEEAE